VQPADFNSYGSRRGNDAGILHYVLRQLAARPA